jgi:hypothetical protein
MAFRLAAFDRRIGIDIGGNLSCVLTDCLSEKPVSTKAKPDGSLVGFWVESLCKGVSDNPVAGAYFSAFRRVDIA